MKGQSTQVSDWLVSVVHIFGTCNDGGRKLLAKEMSYSGDDQAIQLFFYGTQRIDYLKVFSK